MLKICLWKFNLCFISSYDKIKLLLLISDYLYKSEPLQAWVSPHQTQASKMAPKKTKIHFLKCYHFNITTELRKKAFCIIYRHFCGTWDIFI